MHVVGFSLGCYVASIYAATYPHKTASVSFIAPAAGFNSTPTRSRTTRPQTRTTSHGNDKSAVDPATTTSHREDERAVDPSAVSTDRPAHSRATTTALAHPKHVVDVMDGDDFDFAANNFTLALLQKGLCFYKTFPLCARLVTPLGASQEPYKTSHKRARLERALQKSHNRLKTDHCMGFASHSGRHQGPTRTTHIKARHTPHTEESDTSDREASEQASQREGHTHTHRRRHIFPLTLPRTCRILLL